jgi:hypothetical protein
MEAIQAAIWRYNDLDVRQVFIKEKAQFVIGHFD